MPVVALTVRVAGFGSEGPEFKSRSAVELIPTRWGKLDLSSFRGRQNECQLAGILCRSGDPSRIVPNSQEDCVGSTNALHRVWSQWMDGSASVSAILRKTMLRCSYTSAKSNHATPVLLHHPLQAHQQAYLRAHLRMDNPHLHTQMTKPSHHSTFAIHQLASCGGVAGQHVVAPEVHEHNRFVLLFMHIHIQYIKPLSHLDDLASVCRRMKNLSKTLAHVEYVMGKFCIR